MNKYLELDPKASDLTMVRVIKKPERVIVVKISDELWYVSERQN